MSRPQIPAPKLTPPPDGTAPPDLSGGGDTIVEAPAEGRSTRPGPQPKVIRETFSNPGIATAPDVKLLNERKYDSARSKVRAMAVEKMANISIGTTLPGPPLATEEGAEPAAEVVEDAPPVVDAEPTLDAKTAAQIAAKDREVRELKRKMRAIETSGLSAAKKEAKLKEIAKTNPKGVAEYLGIDFQAYLLQVQRGENAPVTLEEDKPVKVEDDETGKLRRENARLRATEDQRLALDAVTAKVMTIKGEDGRLRWPRIARVGDEAKQEAITATRAEAAKMRRLSPAEAHKVLEHFLDVTEAKYARAAGSENTTPQRQPPNPRRPQTVAPKNPMENRTAKDETDPRNRPTSREIAARVRARLIG